MASNAEKAELPEPDATGIPRAAQTTAVIPAKHRVGVLEGAERNRLQAVQDSDGAGAAPLTLHVNEDLLRYLADEADKSGRSLSSEIVRRLLHSRAQARTAGGRMKDVVVIGAGKIGATVAGLLASTGDYQVILANHSPEVLGNLDRDERIRIAAADVEDS